MDTRRIANNEEDPISENSSSRGPGNFSEIQNRTRIRGAEAELDESQNDGTPRDKYTRVLLSAGKITSLANGLASASFEDLIFNMYKTRNLEKIPDAVLATARLHPDVLSYSNFQYTQPLDATRDSFGDGELTNAHTRQ